MATQLKIERAMVEAAALMKVGRDEYTWDVLDNMSILYVIVLEDLPTVLLLLLLHGQRLVLVHEVVPLFVLLLLLGVGGGGGVHDLLRPLLNPVPVPRTPVIPIEDEKKELIYSSSSSSSIWTVDCYILGFVFSSASASYSSASTTSKPASISHE